jgi:hypothetical protein
VVHADHRGWDRRLPDLPMQRLQLLRGAAVFGRTVKWYDRLKPGTVLCKCGHPESAHSTPLLAGGSDRYDGRVLCQHVPMLGTFSMSALRDDCGCEGWEPDPNAKPHECAGCDRQAREEHRAKDRR